MRLFCLLGFIAVCGCGSISDIGDPGGYAKSPGTFQMSLGQKFDISVGTIGPGSYADPPDVSSSIVRYLGSDGGVGTNPPGGPLQRFHFMAASPGTAIIKLRQVRSPPFPSDSVMDTIVVR